jgi:hypothetical protein
MVRHGSRRGSWNATALVDARERGPTDADGAGVGGVQSADLAQQRGLAAAGRAEQGDDLSRGDVQGDVAQHTAGRVGGACSGERAAHAGQADGQRGHTDF